jgi:hypothetical protein
MPTALLLLIWSSIEGCYLSCNSIQISLPGNPGDDGNDDGNTNTETGDSGGDTGTPPPPPPCTFPEVEPNNTLGEAFEITAEAWACGTLLSDGEDMGVDFVTFTVAEDGWLSLWGRGEDVGSFSDLSMSAWVYSEVGGDDLAIAYSSPGSSDPRLTIPVHAGDVIKASIRDQNGGTGEQYIWELLGTMEKYDPLDCTLEEDETAGGVTNNDVVARANQTLANGDTLCGVTGTSDNGDVYRIEIPEGRTDVVLEVIAWQLGSPADITITLYDPTGETVSSEAYGELSTDLDPTLERTILEPGVWFVEIESPPAVGDLYWYGLKVTAETSTDTGI